MKLSEAKKLRKGDKVVLTYTGFDHCPRGSIVEVDNVFDNDSIGVVFGEYRYVVTETDITAFIQMKERVQFT